MIDKKAIVALIWSLAGQIGSTGISTIFVLVFARFMSPSDFGLFAACAMVTNLASMLAGLGFGTALIQQKRFDASIVSTAFWAVTVTSAVLSGLIMALAVPIAWLFRDPRIPDLLLPMVLVIIVGNGTAILTAALRRELNLRALAIRAVFTNLAAGLIATPLVLAGYGALGLAIQSLANAIFSFFLTILLVGWPVRLRLDLIAVQQMLKFGIPVMKSDFLSIANIESPKFFIGVFLGSEALGLYSIATRILNLLLQIFGAPLSSVTFPLMSEVHRSEPHQVGEIHMRFLKLAMAATLPVFLVFSSFGGQIVTLLFGPIWAGAGPLSVYLSLSGFLLALGYVNGATMMAIGHSQDRYNFVLAGVLVGTILLVTMTPLGLVWVGLALLLRAIFSEVLLFRGLLRLLGLEFTSTLLRLMPQALSGLILAITAAAVQFWWRGPDPLLFVAVGSGAALSCYILATWVLDRGVFSQISLIARGRTPE